MLWQADHCREQSVGDWVETLRLGDIDCFRIKTHQHLNWMANVYSHPLAPTGLDQVQRDYEAFGEQGITYLPWCVPMGLDVAREADLAIAVARRCGNAIDIDLEIGEDFWDYRRLGTRGIVDYFTRLKDAGIWVMCDTAMFEGWVEALALAEIAPFVDRFLSQAYWHGFGRSYESVIRHDIAEMRRFTTGEIGIIAHLGAPPAELAAGAALAQSLGAVEFSGWAADFANVASYEGYRLIPSAPFWPAPVPEPEPVDEDAIWAELTLIGRDAQAAGQALSAVSQVGDLSITVEDAISTSHRVADEMTAHAARIRELVGVLG